MPFFLRKSSHSHSSKRPLRKLVFDVLELETRLMPALFTPTFQLFHPADGITPLDGSATPSGTTPSQMRTAYGVNIAMFGSITGDGTGQTIAIVDAYNQPNIASDLTAFDAYYGLPDPPSFTVRNQSGGTSLPSNSSINGWSVEITLDVEWAHVIAPNASILLIEANSNSDANLYAAVDTARNYGGVSAVSMSWGGGESGGDVSANSHFTTPSGHTGVTFLASSGDSGAGVIYPSASPNVVAVGGTSLFFGSGGSYSSESGWSGSGGGLSSIQSQPTYQSGIVTQSSTQRAVPDIAMDADPNTGVPIYDTYDNSPSTPWATYGGTSLAAPLWAGVIAIANQGRVQYGESTLDGPSGTLPKLYQLPASNYHDITTGNNGFAAGTGYDLVTGRGSPIVNQLVNALVGDPPTITGLSPTSGPVSGGTSVTITGINFTGATAVNFGAVAAASFTVNSATQITATSPPGGGVVDVTVTTTGGTSVISRADHFTYNGAVVTGISPTTGPGTGGASVIITGAGFTGATSVKFGATNATTFTINSDTQITATSPAGSGVVDVTVATPVGGTSATSNADHFTYVPVPTITGVSPNTGPATGGTSVIITGTGFTGASAVKFGGANAFSYTINSATQITAVDPAGSGIVDITVTVPVAGTSAIASADQFTYTAVPAIGSFTVNPTSVTIGGVVTLTAFNVAEVGGTAAIAGVNFYRESNGTSGLQIGSDTLVGAGTQSDTTWTIANVSTTGLGAGTYTYYAVATDVNSTNSAAAFTTLTVTNPGPVVAWDVNGQTNFGTQGLSATTVAGGLTNSQGLTRGSGVTTTGSAVSNAWGGKNWASTASAGISGNQFASFAITVGTGEVLSLSTIDLHYRRSSGGPGSGYWQYQINSGSWTLIGDFASEFSSTSTSGASITQISLTGISGLQNVAAGTVVHIRVVPYGATSSTASWYVYNQTGNDLSVGGTVTSTLTSTATTITSHTPNPSTTSQAVTFTVGVNASGGASIPDGEAVNLKDASNGNATIGSGTLSSGTATITVAAGALSVGTHNIFAVYSGDATYAASQSATVAQTVNISPTSTTITSNTPNPATLTQAIVFGISVAGGVPNGATVVLKDASNGNAQVGPSGVVSSGVASVTVPAGALTVGDHNIFAVYAGNANFAGSQSSTVTQTITLAPTTTTLVDNGPNPSAPGQTFTMTATISPAVPNGEVVHIRDAGDNSVVGTANFANGIAIVNVLILMPGTHYLYATYIGDTTYAASQSSQLSHAVLTPTTTTLTDNGPNPSTASQTVGFTVTVSGNGGIPNGEAVTLKDASNGNATVGTGTLSGGTATVTVAAGALSVGTHNVFAVYGGDVNFAASQSSTAAQTVNLSSTATTITSNAPNSATTTQAINFGIGVTGGVPDGETVTLKDASNGNATVGTGTLSGGTATVTVAAGALSVGTHNIFAAYSGDANFAGSQSSTVSQTVTLSPTTTSLADNGPNPSTFGQAVSFTATVSGGTAIDGETIFIEDASNANAVVASPTLSAGTVTFTISNLSVGSHNLFAVYSGDAANAGSNSSLTPVTQIVNSVGAAPQLLSTTVNGGYGLVANSDYYVDGQGYTFDLSGQNSVVVSLLVTFNEPVSLDSGAFAVTPEPTTNVAGTPGSVYVQFGNQPNELPIAVNTPVAVGGGSSATQWVLTFSGSGTTPIGESPGFAGIGNLLKDGVYNFNMDGAKVHANAQTAATSSSVFWAMYGANSLYQSNGTNGANGANGGTLSPVLGDGTSELFLDPADVVERNNHFLADSSNQFAPPNYDPAMDADLSGFYDGIDAARFNSNYLNDWTF